MKYADLNCGTRVRLRDGREGKVVAYDGTLVLPFTGGGGFRQRSTRGLKATVRTKDGAEVRALISSLRKA